jgi:hypothetical protein
LLQLEEIHIATGLEHATHLGAEFLRIRAAFQRQRGDEALEAGIRIRQPRPVPRLEFQCSRDSSNLRRSCHESRRGVHPTDVTPPRSTPRFLDNPAIAALEKEHALPCLNLELIEEVRAAKARGRIPRDIQIGTQTTCRHAGSLRQRLCHAFATGRRPVSRARHSFPPLTNGLYRYGACADVLEMVLIA